ncbi:MAG: hypothetical protein AB8B91_17125 [Rubripirellula sp.]
MNEHETEPLITATVNSPTSNPPSLDELRVRLQSRRKRRKRVRLAAGFSVGIAATWLLSLVSSMSVERGAEPQIASVTPIQPSPSVAVDEELPEFAVFARVRQPMPIFHRPEGSELLQHVGWVESEEVVPVNMSQLPEDQRKGFYQVLNEDEPERLIQL